VSDKYLLYPADGDTDEDEGMTKLELLQMLAQEEGYTLAKRQPDVVRFVAETTFGCRPGKEIDSQRVQQSLRFGKHELIASVTVEPSKQGMSEGAVVLRGMADELDRRASDSQ
jgi:hypothetical protein